MQCEPALTPIVSRRGKPELTIDRRKRLIDFRKQTAIRLLLRSLPRDEEIEMHVSAEYRELVVEIRAGAFSSLLPTMRAMMSKAANDLETLADEIEQWEKGAFGSLNQQLTVAPDIKAETQYGTGTGKI